MSDVVIFGAGNSAEVAHALLEKSGEHRVVGFTVDASYAKADHFLGLPLVSWERVEDTFPPSQVCLLGPISYVRLNEFRRDKYLEGKARGYRFASFIHPSCNVFSEEIGEHCLIFPGTVIEPRVKIGNNVIIWGGSYVGHHCVLGDHCFISALVGIGAGSVIGERCFVGGQVAITPRITVGEGSVLSQSAVITKSIPPRSIVRPPGKTTIAPFSADQIRNLLQIRG
jgi:sugar O-acyltransferase (sialic acid O-acetyltransferase NeuD family)